MKPDQAKREPAESKVSGSQPMFFLVGGVLYGAVLGFALPYVVEHRPWIARAEPATQQVAAPRGPMAPTQVGTAPPPPTGAQAPMMAEINALKERLDADPRDLAALTRLANLYHDVEMWEQAAVFYERAVELSPSDPDLITDMGISYHRQGQHDRALQLFERAQRADPTHWKSLFNTAVVAGLFTDEFERAEAALSEVERLQPSLPQTRGLRADIERRRAAAGSGG